MDDKNEKLPNGNESRTSELMRAEVKTLFSTAEGIRKVVQKAAKDNNPLFNDFVNLRRRHGIEIDEADYLDNHDESLRKIISGDIKGVCLWFYEANEAETKSLPRITIEGNKVYSMDLTYYETHAENTQPVPGRPFYELSFQIDNPQDADLENQTAVFHKFYFSAQGDWLKEREDEFNPASKSADVNVYDLETAGLSLQVFRSYLDQIFQNGHPQTESNH